MKNRKRGQGIIEYVLLLMIPLLVIAVIPNINNTLEMTLSTVGVDLLEEMGDVEVSCTDGSCEDIVESVIYPPIAKFDLPLNCGITGVYQKGRPIRLINSSYDIDGDIDHLQWWVERRDVNGEVDPLCTTPQDNPIIVNRADLTNLSTGLTISGAGYGNHTIYGDRDCMRDPGSFTVKLRVYDNDGLVSQEFSDEFEIRDVRPSISISATVSDYAKDSIPHQERTITQKIVSDACKFSPTDGLQAGDKDNTPRNVKDTDADVDFVKFDNHYYLYIESCPYIEGHYDGIVTFTINNYNPTEDLDDDEEGTQGIAYTDPDFVAIDGIDKTFEGETNPEKNRHGFTYVSRFISSVETDNKIDNNYSTIRTIPTATAEITLFKTGANIYTKQFKEGGTYLFDASVWDENQVSAKSGAQEDGRKPNVGVAVRVLSEADPDFLDKCNYKIDEKTCPKPQIILAVDKYGNGDTETIYTSVGAYGYDTKSGHINASNIDSSNFLDDGESIPSSKYSKTINDLIEDGITYLNMDIFKTTKTINGKSITFPVFAPAAGERLRFRPLTYFGDTETFAHCIPDTGDALHYWATSDHYLNNFNFKTLSHGDSPTVWNNSGTWGQVYRPYKEDGTKPMYSASNMGGLTGITDFWNQTSSPITNKAGVKQNIVNGEILYTMVRNAVATSKYTELNPNPFAKTYKNGNNSNVYDDVNEPVTTRIDFAGNPLDIEDAQIRSNGQLFLIAPKQEMCPLSEQRPIPKLSIRANKVDVDGETTETTVELTSDITIEVDGMGVGTFSLDGVKYQLPCETTGCMIQVASELSTCGTGAADDCEIQGSRWKFDRVVTDGYPAIINDDNIYYPNTSKITKFTHTYYGEDSGKTFDANTLTSGTLDSIWDNPINEHTDTYAYYGDYKNQTNSPTMKNDPRFDWSADDYLSTVAPNARTVPSPNKMGTNIESGYNTKYKPDLFTNVDGHEGYFIEAVDLDDTTTSVTSGYNYELEIIDSQGCATSTSRKIKVVKMTNKPVAYCNYIYHYVSNNNETLEEYTGSAWDEAYDEVSKETVDLLKNYEYYDGKMVQNIATFTTKDGVYLGDKYILPIVIENGDYITETDDYKPSAAAGTASYTARNGVRTSPLFMFSNFAIFKKMGSDLDFQSNGHAGIGRNELRGDDGEFFTLLRNSAYEAGSNFVSMYDKSKEYLYSDKVDDITYNPRTAQMLTGEKVSDYLNAKGSLFENADEPLMETGDTGIKANWKIYKVDLIHAESVTRKEVEDNWNTGEVSFGVNLTNQQTTSGMTSFNFYGAKFTEPTESNLVCESNGTLIEDGPNCTGSQALNEPGYYIVKLVLDNTNMPASSSDKYSNEIECRIKVKVPTLDFKCPWGETVKELKENAIEFTVEKKYDPTTGMITESLINETPVSDILHTAGVNLYKTTGGEKTLIAEDVFIGNDRITALEVTPYMYQDPYRFDEAEKDAYSEELIRFIDHSNIKDRYIDLPINTLEGTKYSGSSTAFTCTPSDKNSCYNQYITYLKSERGSADFYLGVIMPRDANHMIQPLSLSGSNGYGGLSWNPSDCSDYNSCNAMVKTLPLELWLTKYYIGELSEAKAKYADSDTIKEYDYLLDLVEENINTEYYNDIAFSGYLDFVKQGMNKNDRNAFHQAIYEFKDVSPSLEILATNISDIAEIIAYKYDKSVITWTDLQIPFIDELILTQTDESTFSGRTTAIFNFYYGNIRKNISTSTTTATNHLPPSAIWGYERYDIRSPFYGKYLAVKRFEAINYFKIQEKDKDSDFADFDEKMKGIQISPLNEALINSVSTLKNRLYFDYKSVSLNQGTHVLSNTNLSNEPVQISQGGTPLNKTRISGLSSGLMFTSVPYNTLSLMKEKSPGWKTADNILENVSYERGLANSRLVFLRVNSISNNPNDYITYKEFDTSKTHSVPNAYSKICPIVVKTEPTQVGSVACNLKVPGMASPQPELGYQFDGIAYYTQYADTSRGHAGLDPYRLSGEKMLKFEHTDEGTWRPELDLNNSKEMLLSARMLEATKMNYTFTVDGSTASISFDISPIDPDNPLDSQFEIVQNNFNTALNSIPTSFRLSRNDNLSSIEQIWLSATPVSSAEQCMSTSLNYWRNLWNYNIYDNAIDEGSLIKTYSGGNCHLRYNNPGQNTWYDILEFNYSFSFAKPSGELLEIDGDEKNKSCTTYSAHASKSSVPWGEKARIIIGDVENRIQYTSKNHIYHSDFSTYPNGKTRGPGVYPAGTKCFWEITGSGFAYQGRTYSLTSESSNKTKQPVTKGDGKQYRFNAPYWPGAQIQEDCEPIIDGKKKIYTTVDIRDPNDTSKTGFVVQRLWVHQNAENQNCYGDQGQVFVDAGFTSGTLKGTKSYCRAGTMYAVTKGDGKGNTVIVGSNLRGSDVFLAIQYQNGYWSGILEYVDKKWGGQNGVWVYYNY